MRGEAAQRAERHKRELETLKSKQQREVATLELEKRRLESEKESAALSTAGEKLPPERIDQRTVMLLKAQNSQLTSAFQRTQKALDSH